MLYHLRFHCPQHKAVNPNYCAQCGKHFQSSVRLEYHRCFPGMKPSMLCHTVQLHIPRCRHTPILGLSLPFSSLGSGSKQISKRPSHDHANTNPAAHECKPSAAGRAIQTTPDIASEGSPLPAAQHARATGDRSAARLPPEIGMAMVDEAGGVCDKPIEIKIRRSLGDQVGQASSHGSPPQQQDRAGLRKLVTGVQHSPSAGTTSDCL